MNKPKPQEKQSLDPRDYKVVVCVAGTRWFNDKRYFHEKIMEFLETQTEPVLFISGAAASGADNLIIRWCRYYGYPCKQVPADWENQGGKANFNWKIQGFVRNDRMADMITHLIAFFDGSSPGTTHMLGACEKRGRQILTYLIKPQPKPAHDSNPRPQSQPTDLPERGRAVGSEAGNDDAHQHAVRG